MTNAIVTVSGGNVEGALKKLDRVLVRTGVRAAMMRHAFRRTPSQARRLKSKKARLRARKNTKKQQQLETE